MEGWLTKRAHRSFGGKCGGDPVLGAAFAKDAGQALKLHPGGTEQQLAGLSAKRAAWKIAPRRTSLLPQEFAKRYHQQFIDGLWMRGLVACLSAYIIGVLIYFGALYVLKMKYTRVKQDLAGIGGSYTNSLRDADPSGFSWDRQGA